MKLTSAFVAAALTFVLLALSPVRTYESIMLTILFSHHSVSSFVDAVPLPAGRTAALLERNSESDTPLSVQDV